MIDIVNLDWSRCYLPPFEHQKTGVCHFLVNKYTALFDEQGAGKTKQVIDAACFLYEAEDIDTVLIICPAQVKDVWAHPVYSQIIEHSFVRGIIHEFTSQSKRLPDKSRGLLWIVVSVELLRNPSHVAHLAGLLRDRKFWAVDDESSTISNFKASQTRGAIALTRRAKKRAILNGTPYGNSGVLGFYSQMHFLDQSILGFRNYYAFRNHHAKMGGWMGKQVVGFLDIEGLQKKIKPYALRRLKRDCLDLPPKIMAPLKEVRLTPQTWKHYCSMRDEFVAYLESTDEVSVVTSAPVKALRLAQICSGFLGGIEDGDGGYSAVEIGCELTNAFMEYFAFRLETTERFWLIVWARFRPEIARLEKLVRQRFPDVTVRVLQGGLSKVNREEAKSLFHPDAPDPKGPALLIGQPQAGRFGLNFAKCSNVDRLSSDYSLLTKLQSDDRVDRPGQKNSTLFQEYVVVGPNRERTISGIILKALQNNEDMAAWVTSRWITEILQIESDYEPF
jgi:SNF2-related domain